MFGWFRKKTAADDIAEKGKAIFDTCVEVFRRSWIDLNPQTRTPEELAAEMESFAQSAFRLMLTKFPLTKDAPPSFLWNTVFTAVLKAKTHTTDDVNKAISLLADKYAR